MQARILPAAKARLIEIWDYTFEKWGEGQADNYVRRLVAAMHNLAQNRSSWRRVPDKSFATVWVVRHEHHYIFFKELPGGGVGVITVLHEKMDLPARLIEDASRANQQATE